MTHALVLQGVTHEVWLARAGDGYRLHAGGVATDVALRPHAGHAHTLVVGGEAHRVHVAVQGGEIHVHLDGDTWTLRHLDDLERFAGAASDDAGSVARAPMPGSVIAVHVEPGLQVARGAPLVVIESMKMETVIVAAHDGTVAQVHVAPGQTFERDAPLVTLQRPEAGA